MSNVAEIDSTTEILRSGDDDLIKFIDQWEADTHRYVGNPQKNGDLARLIATLEGQIVRCTPCTYYGLFKVLHMAHMIMSARDANPDCYTGDGPVTMLIMRAIYAVDHQDGVIGRTGK